MDARNATTRAKMTPMNQGASLHSPTAPPILSLLSRGSHLRMEPQPSAKGMHESPIPKFISAQTAEPTKA